MFAPTKPLVERLGKKFFRKAPARPGVYLMRNTKGEVVYVGKAKNLRQRLQNYRAANPERMPRRHLRMVREVARINFGLCHNESAALEHEARLIRKLKPKFNRVGVRPGKARFLTWRFVEDAVDFSVHEVAARRLGTVWFLGRLCADPSRCGGAVALAGPAGKGIP